MGSIRVSLERTGGIAGYLDCFPKITGSYAHNVVKKGKVNWSDENNTLVNTLAISHVFFRVQGMSLSSYGWLVGLVSLSLQ